MRPNLGRRLTVLVAALVVPTYLTAVTATSVAAEHRTVEWISTGPADPQGGAPNTFYRGTSTDGSVVFFRTDEPMVAADTDAAEDTYVRSGGQTRLVSVTETGANAAATAFYNGNTPDGSTTFFTTAAQMAAGDTDGVSDVYRWHDGQVTLESTGPSLGPIDGVNFAGATPDGSHVYWLTDESFDPQDTDGFLDVYERFNGQTRLVSKGPQTGAPAIVTVLGAVSPDGSRAIVSTGKRLSAADTDNRNDVYANDNGAVTLLSIGSNGGNGDFDSGFAAASADASRVLIRTNESLDAADTDTQMDLYLAGPGGLSLVSDGTDGSDAAEDVHFDGGMAANGHTVVFDTPEQLTADDTDATSDLYAWTDGALRLVSSATGGTSEPFLIGVSADGSRITLETDGALLPTDTDTEADVYQEVDGTLVQLSNGAATDAQVQAASADGTRVLWTTDSQVLPTDTDTDTDIYESRGGQITLVTPGVIGFAEYEGMTPSGNRVFFNTPGAADPGDTDGGGDVYASTLAAPAALAPPVVSGSPVVGQSLACSTGTWDGDPVGFAYRWNRDGAPIAGATGATYAVVTADVGHQLSCTVTATNDAGSTSATSAPVTVPVPATPPPPPTQLLPGACANPQTGTAHKDVLAGTVAGDRISGLGGDDRLTGLGAADCLRGGPGRDKASGGPAKDVVDGGGGGDVLRGNGGADRLLGRGGDDRLVGGGGRDKLLGGGGDDRINAADGKRDKVLCGAGEDTVRADAKDRLVGCENVV